MIGIFGRSHIAAFSSANGALLPWAPRVSGRVRPIVATPSYVYIGGNFADVFGIVQPRLARLSPVTGALDTTWRPRVTQIPAGSIDPSTGKPAKCPPRCSPEVTSLALANTGNVYVGGHFGLVNGTYPQQRRPGDGDWQRHHAGVEPQRLRGHSDQPESAQLRLQHRGEP